jgi:hypothetical protein
MVSKFARRTVPLLLLVLGALMAGSAFAGSLIVGSIAGATNANLGGQEVIAGNTIFSGDNLQVHDGAAIVTVGSGSRMVFGKNSVVSFERQTNEVTALLSGGNVSVYHPADDSVAVRLRTGNLSIEPGKGFKTLGEVAMVGDSLTVKATEGLLRIDGAGDPLELRKGQSAKFIPKVARSPQTAGGAQTYGGGGGNWVTWLAVAAGGTAAVLAGVSISRSSDAKDAANAATAAANQSDADAKAAAAAAAAADADAKAAAAAAAAADAQALAAGCALNKNNPLTPFTPANGESCP